MLELAKILRDIDDLGRERAASFAEIPEQIKRASGIIADIDSNLDASRARIMNARTSWLVADFKEPPSTVYDLPPVPEKHAVVATDGSQIMPGKHEVTLCYLLNTSWIILYYGTGERPIAKTIPKLAFRDEDIFEEPYGGKRVPVNDKILGNKRTIEEAKVLEQAIIAAKASGIPTVALCDGSLIRWSIENEPSDYRDRVLSEYLQVFDTARDLGVPIAGYISDPGSRDFCNCLKIMLCDQTPIDCDKCLHKPAGNRPPCEGVGRLRDSSLFTQRLKGGKRSTLFSSSSSILERYGAHRILAFYMDVGPEIARIEVPEWVAENRELLDLTHAVSYDQAMKGSKYPIALTEAHEHAVVKGPDRAAFYDLVERSFVKHNAKFTYSMKRISKGY